MTEQFYPPNDLCYFASRKVIAIKTMKTTERIELTVWLGLKTGNKSDTIGHLAQTGVPARAFTLIETKTNKFACHTTETFAVNKFRNQFGND